MSRAHKRILDWSSAYTRIGIIMTRTAGGLGYILGGLIEQIVTALGEEPTPPPSTTPFPWQSGAIQEQSPEIPKVNTAAYQKPHKAPFKKMIDFIALQLYSGLNLKFHKSIRSFYSQFN